MMMEMIRNCPHCGEILLDPRKKVAEFIPPSGFVEVRFHPQHLECAIQIFADNDMEWLFPLDGDLPSRRAVLLSGLYCFLATVTEFYSAINLYCNDPMFAVPGLEPQRHEKVEWDLWKDVKSRLARRSYISINYSSKKLLNEKLNFLKARFNRK